MKVKVIFGKGKYDIKEVAKTFGLSEEHIISIMLMNGDYEIVDDNNIKVKNKKW